MVISSHFKYKLAAIARLANLLTPDISFKLKLIFITTSQTGLLLDMMLATIVDIPHNGKVS